MTVPLDRTYPKTAMNDVWQKKKSFLDKAKSKTKTGLGADLDHAEAMWLAIPWLSLDARTLGAKTVSAAQEQLDTAKKAATKVLQAKGALTIAKTTATQTAGNKALSKTAAAAAKAIAADLAKAITRLDSVNVTDFEQNLQRLQKAAIVGSIVNITKLSVSVKGKQVATAADATWDRKVLKATGVNWTEGAADDYRGQTLKISGTMEGNSDSAGGISQKYENDMKLTATSGATASFQAY